MRMSLESAGNKITKMFFFKAQHLFSFILKTTGHLFNLKEIIYCICPTRLKKHTMTICLSTKFYTSKFEYFFIILS